MCSVITMLHDIQHGYKDEKITFAGIGGSSYFLNTLKTEAGKLQNSPNMDNILARKLDTTAKEYSDSITAFYNQYKANTVKGCKPVLVSTSAADVTPGVITALTDNINDAIKTEKEQFVQIATQINDITTNVKQIAGGGQTSDLLNQLSGFIKTLDDTNKRITEAKTEYVEKIQYKKAVGWLRVALWTITGTVVFLLILNLLIMFCTLHWKCCLGMNMLSKLLMTLKLTIGGGISSISITFMTVAIISSNFCSLFKESMEDKTLLKGFLPEYPYKFAESCIYADSKGELTFLMDNLGSFGDQLKKFDDLDKFKDLADPIKNIDKSQTLDGYKTSVLTKFRNFENLDTLGSGEEFKANLDNLNTKAQAILSTENYRLDTNKCPSDAEKFTSGHANNYGKDRKYCIVVPDYGFDQVATRYAPRLEANNPYTGMRTCSVSYRTKIDAMVTSLNGDPVTKSTKLITDVKASLVDINAISDQLKSSSKFLKEISGKITKVLDCRLLRKEAKMIEGALCGVAGFNRYFTLQAYLLTFIGPLLTLLGICLCCQTRLADRDKHKVSRSSVKGGKNAPLTGKKGGKHPNSRPRRGSFGGYDDGEAEVQMTELEL